MIDVSSLSEIQLRQNSFVFQEFAHALCEIMHVVKVRPGSAAQMIGMRPLKDYILSTQSLKFQDMESFIRVLGEKNSAHLTLYNSDSNSLRTVNTKFQKYLGCQVVLLKDMRSINTRKFSELSSESDTVIPTLSPSQSFYGISEKMAGFPIDKKEQVGFIPELAAEYRQKSISIEAEVEEEQEKQQQSWVKWAEEVFIKPGVQLCYMGPDSKDQYYFKK